MLGNPVIQYKPGDVLQFSIRSARICHHLQVGTRSKLRGWDQNIRCTLFLKPRLDCIRTRPLVQFKVHAVAEETDQPKWWEKNAGANMVDIHSTQEFVDALSQAGDRLVIVDFYGTWCASCRALFPKLCKIAEEHPEVLFLKVNFDENKGLCKSLNIKVLPYFHFYRGADRLVESFSCSLAKPRFCFQPKETPNENKLNTTVNKRRNSKKRVTPKSSNMKKEDVCDDSPVRSTSTNFELCCKIQIQKLKDAIAAHNPT